MTIAPFDSDKIQLSQLAADLKISSSQLRRWALSEGFQFVKMRTSRGHLALALSPSDAAALVERRRQLGFPVANKVTK